MRWRLCVLCASLPQQAFISKHGPEEISQTPSLCHWGMLPPFTQDFSWSFKVKLVHRKTFSNKGTADQGGNNVLKAVKREEMAGSHGWLIVFCCFLFIFLNHHWASVLCTTLVPLYLTYSKVKAFLLRLVPPVWCDSCCKRTTTRSRVGESAGAAYLSDTDCWPATSLPCTSILLGTSSRSKVVCLEGFPPFQ